MSTQAEAAKKPAAAEVEFTPHSRLVSAMFVNSVPYDGEASSVQIGRNCESIVAARLEPDGTAVAISSGQRADGILVRRRKHELNSNARYVQQVFVPFANIRGLGYGA